MASNLTHIFKVNQPVKCKNPDTGKFYDGVVKETYPDHIIVNVFDVCDHMWYESGINLDCVYPDYCFNLYNHN